MVATTETVIGRDIEETLGAIRGSTIRTQGVDRDIAQELRDIVGGELKSYTGLMAEAHDEVTDRMVTGAEAMGADAVISIQYVTAEVAQGAAEILAYGTAVTLVGSTDPGADAEPASESNVDVA